MVWKPLVICPDEALVRALETALAEWQGAVIREYPAAVVALELAGRHLSNVCFLDGATNAEAASALIGPLAGAGCPVVLLYRNDDGSAILRGLRLGASEFLIPPFGAAETAAVLRRLGARGGDGQSSGPHRVFCMLPGKGSCGCTTLAVHLAVHLAAQPSGRVLLADFDLMTGAVGFQLNLKPAFSSLDALTSRERIDEEMWSRLVTPVRGLDVLAAPPEATLPQAGMAPAALIAFWRKRYATTLIDCSMWGGELTAGVTHEADLVLVVAANEIAALHGTRRTLAMLERSGVPAERLALVVSRYHTGTGLDRAAIEQALHHKVFAVLPNDFAGVQEKLVEGGTLNNTYRFGRAVVELARRLPGAEVEARPATQKRSSFFSLLLKSRPA